MISHLSSCHCFVWILMIWRMGMFKPKEGYIYRHCYYILFLHVGFAPHSSLIYIQANWHDHFIWFQPFPSTLQWSFLCLPGTLPPLNNPLLPTPPHACSTCLEFLACSCKFAIICSNLNNSISMPNHILQVQESRA